MSTTTSPSRRVIRRTREFIERAPGESRVDDMAGCETWSDNRLKQTIPQDQKALGDFQEEARRAGVPPGWLR